MKLDNDALYNDSLLFLFFPPRSKLGLFQSRISLQKASVKVRGLAQRDTDTTPSLTKMLVSVVQYYSVVCLSLPAKSKEK